jgi:hypothetical protein
MRRTEGAVRSSQSARSAGYTTSAFIKEALDKGAAMFNWEARQAQSGKA